MRVIACIAEKHTKKQLSDFIDIDVLSVYAIPNELEYEFKMVVDGKNTYADYIVIEE